MNTQQRAVIRHMIEALEQATPHMPVHTDWHFEAIEWGKKLLEQPEQSDEPDGLHLAAVELARQQHTVIQDLQETLAAVNRQVKSLTEARPTDRCRYPVCMPDEYQQKLADDIATELVGKPAAPQQTGGA